MSHSFQLTGLFDEPLASGTPALLPPQDASRRRTSRSRSPRRGTTKTRKYSGVFQQGGEGADDEFALPSRVAHAELLRNYEEANGSDIDRAARPSITQLSAIRQKLRDDVNPSPDLATFGPHGDRFLKALSHVEDVIIDGVRAKRRFRGQGR